jgi:hypothetical protein
MEKSFNFSIEDIKKIYRAGMRRGSEEATSYEWGCRPCGDEYDECVEEIDEIINDGKSFNDESRTDYEEIKSWFKED